MRAFPRRIAPLALLLGTGLFANGPSASGQEAVRTRPVERAPPIVTTYPSPHVDLRPTTSLPPTATPPVPTANTSPCCGPTTAGPEENPGGGEAAEAAETVAGPADNDALAESVVDMMIGELPVAAKQRSAE